MKGLSANVLKLIAIIAMTLDHLAWTIAPGYSRIPWVLALHLLGRITAPIMWFFIVEGYHHTRSVRRYAKRLFLLAFLSHFAYNFCFHIPFIPFLTGVFNQTSIVWSLAWGLVLLWIADSSWKPWIKYASIPMVCLLTFPADWSCTAAMAILFMGSCAGNFRQQMLWLTFWSAVYGAVYFLFLDPVYGLLQLGTCLSIPMLSQYNGQLGKWKGMGKLFYYYYPAHLFLCGILRLLIA